MTQEDSSKREGRNSARPRTPGRRAARASRSSGKPAHGATRSVSTCARRACRSCVRRKGVEAARPALPSGRRASEVLELLVALPGLLSPSLALLLASCGVAATFIVEIGLRFVGVDDPFVDVLDPHGNVLVA